jgi:hypothetical protein
MSTTPRIRRSDFIQSTQDNLAVFAENVVAKCADKAYDPVKAFITPVVEASANYRKALTDAALGGKVFTELKKVAKESLIKKLGVLASLLEVQPNATNAYLLGAGFSLFRDRTSNAEKSIFKPTILKAKPNGQVGQLVLEIDKGNSSGIQSIGYEFSEDNGETWKNGSYSNRSTFVMPGLPTGKDILIRARSLGTYDKVSEWSDAFMAFVHF